MEAECSTYCSSLDAIRDESELIAHLQSMFWSSSYADPSHSFSSNCSSLPSSSSFPLTSSGENYGTMVSMNSNKEMCFGHQDDNLVICNKRKNQMDAEHEQMNHTEDVYTAMSEQRKAGNHAVQCSKSKSRKQTVKDSPSHYAKKRRQRINKRLRTLQELIPNGTKVEISTMLEEAVQYVKFLHLQIKFLSSDEMWIYAPLIYKGVSGSI